MTSSASHSNCSRVRLSSGKATSPSSTWAAPSRFSLRQTAIRGDEGSRGSRYARSTHFARPTVLLDVVTTVTYSTRCPFHTTGMDNRRHAPGTRLALWLWGARLLSRAHPSDVPAPGGSPPTSSAAPPPLSSLAHPSSSDRR